MVHAQMPKPPTMALGGHEGYWPAPCVKREKKKTKKTHLPGDYSAFPIDWYRLLCTIGQNSRSLTLQSFKPSRLANVEPHPYISYFTYLWVIMGCYG